jgi:hypothetical protein
VSTGCVVVTAPPEEFAPPELRGRPVLAIPVLYVGDPEAGAAAMQPLRDLGPAVDHIGRMPYTAFQAALDLLAPWDPGGFFPPRRQVPLASDYRLAGPRPRREDDRCHLRVRGRHTPVQHRRLVPQLHPRGRPGPRRLRRRQVRPLVALNNSYDPANLFRLNQNIRPSQPAAEPVLA